MKGDGHSRSEVSYSNRDKILAAAKHDPTIMAVIRTANYSGADWLETVELMVLQLAAEKKNIQDAFRDYVDRDVRPFLLPADWEQKK